MNVTVLGFASVTDALGTDHLELELAAGSRIADLRRHLDATYPALKPLWPRLAIAVNGVLARGDVPLPDGCEVALLPPVSGGSRGGSRGASHSGSSSFEALVEGPLDTIAVTAAVESADRGAVLLFLGTVRNHHAGRTVSALTYSAYRSMAAARIETICSELSDEGDNLRVALSHRLGEVPVGEPSVAIAVASPHREAAYRASRRALERLKTEVPIWKREHYAGGEAAWREEEPLAPSELDPVGPA